MGQFSQRLGSISKVGLDTTVFIYHFEKHPIYSPLTQEILSNIEKGILKGITSSVILMEIIVKPLSMGRNDIARKYEALLMNFPNLEVVDLDRDVIRQAARLRAEYRLRPPDALQVSACLLGGAEAFVTNDRRIDRIKGKLDIVDLDDFNS
ncbi:MAG TPA: type II toxin-antitoxin system VapC family toxin [Anaerolineaceae bacterium]|nr:type II toxin-antitoxin system VapC family toxin [Anaerolineaceae bacterium]